MSNESLDEMIRSAWQELGFYYESDEQAKEWRLVGSRAGLLRFRDLLIHYTKEPKNTMKSEHEHYGPYFYLEVMTWPEPGMDSHAIYGSVEDLRRLASLVEKSLVVAKPGATIRLKEEFGETSEYTLVLDLREDDFDPASADPDLKGADR